MQWNNVSEFFSMGGYAFYVWSSFGLTALVMGVESLQIRRQRAELIGQLRNELLSERTYS
jgi:heme exporter protein D